MSSRPKWRHVVMALGVIAAVAIAAPALGIDRSIKQAIKKEVSKQIAKATGPAGANGTNGINGANGTARAYAQVVSPFDALCNKGPGADECLINHDKGVAAATREGVGEYCVDAPGIDARAVAAVVSVTFANTADPEGNGIAMTHGNCPGTGAFQVRTERHSDSAGTDSVPADDVGFTIIIP